MAQEERSEYVPFVEEGKAWYCGYFHSYDNIFPVTPEDLEGEGIDCIFTMRGDTQISRKDYKKVYCQYKEYYGDEEQHYYCAVREEAYQVFIVDGETMEEKLIYDFSHPYELITITFNGRQFARTEGGRRYNFLPGQLEYVFCTIRDGEVLYNSGASSWIEGVGAPKNNPFTFEYNYLLYDKTKFGIDIFLRSCIVDGKQIFSATWMAVPCVPLAIDDRTYIDNTKKSSYLYDLSGRRIVNPKRGLYIQGGKRVLVKQ
jgi:hypothetical protein